jgi:hypothetical protein
MMVSSVGEGSVWMGCLLAVWVFGLFVFLLFALLALVVEAPWVLLGLLPLAWWVRRRRRGARAAVAPHRPR